MRLKAPCACLFFVAMFLVFFPSFAQSSSPQETLQQYVADLQKNPGDNALREKIIKLALTMNPKPAMPQDAVTHEGAAEYAIKHAKAPADFADAAKEYEQALFLAPWVAADYFNCGVAHEKAEQFDAAVRNFNLYLAASPGAKDANDVLKRIGGLEYAGHKAAKESSPEAVAAKNETDDAAWLKKLDGRRYTMPSSQGTMVIDVRGKVLVRGVIDSSGYREMTWEGPNARVEIVGRETTIRIPPGRLVFVVVQTFIISEDGDKVTVRSQFTDGDVREFIFLWQR